MQVLKMAAKGLAGIALAALLAVNVQVGSGDSFVRLGKASVSHAKADYCNPNRNYCTLDIFFNIIYGEYEIGIPPSPQKN